MAATERVIQESRDCVAAEMWDRQTPITDPIFSTEVAMEGLAAFAKTGPTKWKGRWTEKGRFLRDAGASTTGMQPRPTVQCASPWCPQPLDFVEKLE
jgi:hypothetical protein